MKSESSFDDRLIASRIVAGDTELFSYLVKRHQAAVYNLGLSFFRNREDAGDFTQDVFFKAYCALSDFQGKSKFSTWLYRIAYNTAVNEVKRKKDFVSLAEHEDLPAADDVQQEQQRQATREAVRAAAASLPERFRICIDLYFFYDLSYAEIESVTNIPINTVKSHVFRAKALLKDQLKDEN